MLPSKKLIAMVAGVATASLGLTACGGVSSGGGNAGNDPCKGVEAGSVDSTALKGVTVKPGSKEFDEQLVLGQLTVKMMCAAGAKVVDETNTKGTTQTRAKLTRGGSDVYWGYTGTAWIDFLKQDKPIHDPQKQYDATKKLDLQENDVVWGQLAPFNNTYAFATTSDFAKKNNIESDSDMSAYLKKNPSSTVCVESEFASRPDGYPGFKKAYAFTGGKTKTLGIGVVYTQTAKGNCDFGEVFTTDGRIKALDLHVLQDDKAFFPLYNGAPLVMTKTNEEHPQILEVLKPLALKLTTEVMQELNTEVSSKGEKPAQVATDFLKKEGFLK